MSDSPFPPDKRGKNPRSLANLHRPFAKGENWNPEGRNGRTRAEVLAAVMEEPSESDPERMKIEMVVRAQYRRALKGSDMAAKTLIEQYGGKAKQQVELSGAVSGSRVVLYLPTKGCVAPAQADAAEPSSNDGDANERPDDDQD